MKKLFMLFVLWGLFHTPANAQTKSDRLNLKLSRDAFNDTFSLLFKTEGNDQVDDQDASKISDGYLSLASAPNEKVKLAIEERAYPIAPQIINLYTKVYAAGTYQLKLEWADWLATNLSVTLYDQLLDLKTPINAQQHTYTFTLDTSYAAHSNRFSLLLETRSLAPEPVLPKGPGLIAFPNPCTDQLYLQVKDFAAVASLHLRDLMGRSIWQKTFSQVQPLDRLEIPCQQLTPGLYLLEWRDPANPASLTTLKIIKL